MRKYITTFFTNSLAYFLLHTLKKLIKERKFSEIYSVENVLCDWRYEENLLKEYLKNEL